MCMEEERASSGEYECSDDGYFFNTCSVLVEVVVYFVINCAENTCARECITAE